MCDKCIMMFFKYCCTGMFKLSELILLNRGSAYVTRLLCVDKPNTWPIYITNILLRIFVLKRVNKTKALINYFHQDIWSSEPWLSFGHIWFGRDLDLVIKSSSRPRFFSELCNTLLETSLQFELPLHMQLYCLLQVASNSYMNLFIHYQSRTRSEWHNL